MSREFSWFAGGWGVEKVACEPSSRSQVQNCKWRVLWWVGRPTGGSRANCFKSFRVRVENDAFNAPLAGLEAVPCFGSGSPTPPTSHPTPQPHLSSPALLSSGPRHLAAHPNHPAQSTEKTRIDFDSEGHALVGRGSEALCVWGEGNGGWWSWVGGGWSRASGA